MLKRLHRWRSCNHPHVGVSVQTTLGHRHIDNNVSGARKRTRDWSVGLMREGMHEVRRTCRGAMMPMKRCCMKFFAWFSCDAHRQPSRISCALEGRVPTWCRSAMTLPNTQSPTCIASP